MAKRTRRSATADAPSSAARYIRRSAETMRTGGSGISPWRSEYLSTIKWADNYEKRRPFSYIEQFAQVSEGAEHVVYYDSASNRAIKATKPNRFGHSSSREGYSATPVEYFKRLAWQNRFFGDDIRIEGVAYEDDQIEVITSQPWVSPHPEFPNPTQEEITEYFLGFGFYHAPVSPDAPLYFNPHFGLIVADAHNQNVLRDKCGELAAIDLVIGPPSQYRLQEVHKLLNSTLSWRPGNP